MHSVFLRTEFRMLVNLVLCNPVLLNSLSLSPVKRSCKCCWTPNSATGVSTDYVRWCVPEQCGTSTGLQDRYRCRQPSQESPRQGRDISAAFTAPLANTSLPDSLLSFAFVNASVNNVFRCTTACLPSVLVDRRDVRASSLVFQRRTLSQHQRRSLSLPA